MACDPGDLQGALPSVKLQNHNLEFCGRVRNWPPAETTTPELNVESGECQRTPAALTPIPKRGSAGSMKLPPYLDIGPLDGGIYVEIVEIVRSIVKGASPSWSVPAFGSSCPSRGVQKEAQ